MQENSINQNDLVPCPTKGFGDCAIHATLGEFNEKERKYAHKNPQQIREQLAIQIVEIAQKSTTIRDQKENAIHELVIKEIIRIVHDNKMKSKPEIQKIRKVYENLADQIETEKNFIIANITKIIEHENTALQEKINSYRKGDTLWLKFYNLLQDSEEFINEYSSENLKELIQRYKQQCEKSVDSNLLKEQITNNINLLKEYIEHRITPLGKYLSNTELEILAYCFDISISFYINTNNNFIKIMNPEGKKKIAIFYKNAHYERKITLTELNNYFYTPSRKSFFNAIFSQENTNSERITATKDFTHIRYNTKIKDLQCLYNMRVALEQWQKGILNTKKTLHTLAKLCGGENGLAFNDGYDEKNYYIRNRYSKRMRNNNHQINENKKLRIDFELLFRFKGLLDHGFELQNIDEMNKDLKVLQEKLNLILALEYKEDSLLFQNIENNFNIEQQNNTIELENDLATLTGFVEQYYPTLISNRLKKEASELVKITQINQETIYVISRKLVIIGELFHDYSELFPELKRKYILAPVISIPDNNQDEKVIFIRFHEGTISYKFANKPETVLVKGDFAILQEKANILFEQITKKDISDNEIKKHSKKVLKIILHKEQENITTNNVFSLFHHFNSLRNRFIHFNLHIKLLRKLESSDKEKLQNILLTLFTRINNLFKNTNSLHDKVDQEPIKTDYAEIKAHLVELTNLLAPSKKGELIRKIVSILSKTVKLITLVNSKKYDEFIEIIKNAISNSKKIVNPKSKEDKFLENLERSISNKNLGYLITLLQNNEEWTKKWKLIESEKYKSLLSDLKEPLFANEADNLKLELLNFLSNDTIKQAIVNVFSTSTLPDFNLNDLKYNDKTSEQAIDNWLTKLKENDQVASALRSYDFCLQKNKPKSTSSIKSRQHSDKIYTELKNDALHCELKEANGKEPIVFILKRDDSDVSIALKSQAATQYKKVIVLDKLPEKLKKGRLIAEKLKKDTLIVIKKNNELFIYLGNNGKISFNENEVPSIINQLPPLRNNSTDHNLINAIMKEYIEKYLWPICELPTGDLKQALIEVIIKRGHLILENTEQYKKSAEFLLYEFLIKKKGELNKGILCCAVQDQINEFDRLKKDEFENLSNEDKEEINKEFGFTISDNEEIRHTMQRLIEKYKKNANANETINRYTRRINQELQYLATIEKSSSSYASIIKEHIITLVGQYMRDIENIKIHGDILLSNLSKVAAKITKTARSKGLAHELFIFDPQEFERKILRHITPSISDFLAIANIYDSGKQLVISKTSLIFAEIGDSYRRLGLYKQAINAYRKALKYFSLEQPSNVFSENSIQSKTMLSKMQITQETAVLLDHNQLVFGISIFELQIYSKIQETCLCNNDITTAIELFNALEKKLDIKAVQEYNELLVKFHDKKHNIIFFTQKERKRFFKANKQYYNSVKNITNKIQKEKRPYVLLVNEAALFITISDILQQHAKALTIQNGTSLKSIGQLFRALDLATGKVYFTKIGKNFQNISSSNIINISTYNLEKLLGYYVDLAHQFLNVNEVSLAHTFCDQAKRAQNIKTKLSSYILSYFITLKDKQYSEKKLATIINVCTYKYQKELVNLKTLLGDSAIEVIMEYHKLRIHNLLFNQNFLGLTDYLSTAEKELLIDFGLTLQEAYPKIYLFILEICAALSMSISLKDKYKESLDIFERYLLKIANQQKEYKKLKVIYLKKINYYITKYFKFNSFKDFIEFYNIGSESQENCYYLKIMSRYSKPKFILLSNEKKNILLKLGIDYKNKGEIYFNENKFSSAQFYLEIAINMLLCCQDFRFVPELIECYSTLTRALIKQNKYFKAIMYCNNLAKHNHENKNFIELTVKEFKKYLKNSYKFTFSYWKEGHYHRAIDIADITINKLEKYDASLTIAKTVLKDNFYATKAYLYYYRGCSYFRLGKTLKAKNDFDLCIKTLHFLTKKDESRLAKANDKLEQCEILLEEAKPIIKLY